MSPDKILHRGIPYRSLAASIFGHYLSCYTATNQIDTAACRCSGITFCFCTMEENYTIIGFHISFQFAIPKAY